MSNANLLSYTLYNFYIYPIIFSSKLIFLCIFNIRVGDDLGFLISDTSVISYELFFYSFIVGSTTNYDSISAYFRGMKNLSSFMFNIYVFGAFFRIFYILGNWATHNKVCTPIITISYKPPSLDTILTSKPPLTPNSPFPSTFYTNCFSSPSQSIHSSTDYSIILHQFLSILPCLPPLSLPLEHAISINRLP